MQKWSSIILRVGIGAVIIWFASQQFSNPAIWTTYLPEFTKSLPITQIGFVYVNAWFEVIFGSMMILGLYTRIVAFFLAMHMFGIVYSVGYDPTGVRDFGIAIALFSVFLNGPSSWSLDEYFDRRNN